jgi:hypothetical protein
MSHIMLHSHLEAAEQRLTDSDLDLKVLDRIGTLASCTPNELLHRGVLLAADSSINTQQYRDTTLARVQDSLRVEFGYRIISRKQKARRNEAMVLEEQLRRLLTTGPLLLNSAILSYIGTPNRRLHPQSHEWWITTMTFSVARDAILGG